MVYALCVCVYLVITSAYFAIYVILHQSHRLKPLLILVQK